MTAYIVVACAEAFLRYPEMMRRSRRPCRPRRSGGGPGGPAARSTPATCGRSPTSSSLGPQDHRRWSTRRPTTPSDTATVLDFWERAALAYRAATAPGRRGTPAPHALRRRHGRRPARRAPTPIDDDEHRARVKRFNATLVNHLFLLYFDTRAGYGDTGPYAVPGEPGAHAARARLLPARRTATSRGRDVAADVPYHHLTAALVLDGVREPLHRLRHVEPHARGLPRPPRRLRPVHDRRVARPASSGRCPTRSTTASSPPCARRRRSTTATSPP